MVLGPDPKTHVNIRDEKDMPVDPSAERNLYHAYAKIFGWNIINNVHTAQCLSTVVDDLVSQVEDLLTPHATLPPHYCGPPHANIVVVGDMRGENRIPGSWLPFTSRMTTEFGRLFDSKAFQVGWTNAHNCPPVALDEAKTIIACGKKAQLWVEHYVKGGKRIISVPHPSYLFRFNNETTIKQRESVKQIITNLVKEI
jgi:uracil-DNA glycosylase